jgi:putative ABC transport system permease protein
MLPFSYVLRNLWRRRGRTAVTLLGVGLISLLVALMGGFARGLSETAARTASPDVLVVVGSSGEHDLIRSVITRNNAEAVAASLPHVYEEGGERAASVELHISTRKGDTIGHLRGVTPAAYRVHRRIALLDGREPREPYELLVGRLCAERMGLEESELAVGREIVLEGRPWRVVGHFAAPGTVLEAEMWARLDDVMLCTGRTDVSCVAVRMDAPENMKHALLWVNRNGVAYEISGIPETRLLDSLERALEPIALLAWVMAGLVLVGGVFACANTMFAAILARTRETGTLRALGFGPVAVGGSLLLESLLLGLVGGLLGFWAAGLFGEVPLKFPMGAFYLDLSPSVRMSGLLGSLLAGLGGGLVPAWRAVRMPLPDALGGRT